MSYIYKNFAYSTVLTAPSPATSGTSLVVAAGDGTKFSNGFAVIWPGPYGTQPTVANAEIVLITGISVDTLTIVRTQEGSTNQAIAVGWQIDQGVTAGLLAEFLALSGGTMTGPIAMGSNKVTGLANGTAASDAAAFGQIPAAVSPATTVTGPDAFGAVAVVGTGTTYARADHNHGLPSESVTLTNTVTLTNKRITIRVLALSANSATPAINTDSYDVVHITSQSAAITSFTSSLTGTPVDGDTLRISITGTAAVALTWGTSFEASTVALPTTTVTTARLDVGFFWNTATSKWRCMASA